MNEPTYTNTTPIPTVVLPVVSSPRVAGPTSVTLPNAVRQDLRDPYLDAVQLTIEHQHWDTGFRISYIGTNTRQGEWGYNTINRWRTIVLRRQASPVSALSGITYISNGAGHQYNSLTLEAERRFSEGSRTRSHGCGLAISAIWSARKVPKTPTTGNVSASVWLDIPSHRVTGNLIYRVPIWEEPSGLAEH